jgi:branched-chain amino acid transport system substrate-binding protein
MKGDSDLFSIVANEPASENVLRSCTELGFPA